VQTVFGSVARWLVLLGRGHWAPEGDPIAVIAAERAWGILGQSVAVPLAIGRAHERGHDLEVPLRDVARLTPEVGQANVDVQLEELYAGGSLSHAEKGSKRVGRRSIRALEGGLGL
jgi:hypothetical protein